MNNAENSLTILQICSDEFLKNFSEAFFNKGKLTPWTRDFGAKDILNKTPAHQFFSVLVDSDLSYSRANLLAWARPIAPGGYLALEAIYGRLPESIVIACSSVLEFVPNKNPNVWLFKKKATLDNQSITNCMIEACKSNLSDDEMLILTDKLQQIDPCMSSVAPLIARTRIFEKLGLQQLLVDECHRYYDSNPTATNKIFSSLIRLTYGGNLYPDAFLERKLILDLVGHKRRTPTPPTDEQMGKRWKGENIENKTLVIWTEFGLGDEIMLAQLAHHLKLQRPKKLILIAQPAIVDLLKTSIDIDQIISSEKISEQLGEFDYWVYPHDIYVHIKTPIEQLRKRHPYLTADPKKILQYQPRFPNSGNLKVGIVWRGNPTHENDHYRSIHNIQYIEHLFNIEKIDWYCIQKECNNEEIALLKKYNVPHITKDFESLADTAAAISHLDYLVSVDTSVAHIAGAIGLPTLLLLPYVVDWRWGNQGSHNKWYPNMESFRCNTPAPEWSSAINALKQRLLKLANNPR